MTSMNAYQMEDWVHVHKTVPTQLDHSSAAVFQGTLYVVMPAMILMNVIFRLMAVLSSALTHLVALCVGASLVIS